MKSTKTQGSLKTPWKVQELKGVLFYLHKCVPYDLSLVLWIGGCVECTGLPFPWCWVVFVNGYWCRARVERVRRIDHCKKYQFHANECYTKNIWWDFLTECLVFFLRPSTNDSDLHAFEDISNSVSLDTHPKLKHSHSFLKSVTHLFLSLVPLTHSFPQCHSPLPFFTVTHLFLSSLSLTSSFLHCHSPLPFVTLTSSFLQCHSPLPFFTVTHPFLSSLSLTP